MDSFVKLFKRKASKQMALPDSFHQSQFIPNATTTNLMGASFREKRSAQKYNCDRETNECCNNGMERSHYKSPYSIFTEPKMARSTQSCPVGPPSDKEKRHRMRTFRNLSPPFGGQTIHERSDCYENVMTSKIGQSEKEETERGEERRNKVDGGGDQTEKLQQKGQKQPQQKSTREEAHALEMGDNLAKRYKCHGVHSVAHCSHHQPPLQPLSTSEYWSADPSPVGDSHAVHFRICHQGPPNGMREEMAMTLVGLNMGQEEESSSDDGDNSSDDQEISPTALLQFWQQQVRALKRELKASRETAEKYRNKYLRLKTKTEQLSSELTREKERGNIWLFNQLIAINEKMTQLNWAHQLHVNRESQRQNDFLPMDFAEFVGNGLPFPENNRLDQQIKDQGKCEESNAQHRSTAGEVQAELSSDDFDEKTAIIRERICKVGAEDGFQTMGQQEKQSQLLRTPTPIPMEEANAPTNGLLMANFLSVPGMNFINRNVNGSNIQNQLHVEVARGSHLEGSRTSNSRLISPPIRMGVKKVEVNDTSMTIEEDEKDDSKLEIGEEEDSESLLGTDLDDSVVIPLDVFCHRHIGHKRVLKDEEEAIKGHLTMSVKSFLRHSLSSEDLRSTEKDKMFGSAMGSSSEDDIRMWRKQLRSRGERVLFRPSRKSLFSGVIGAAEKAPNKIFRRFGPPEREALARFDYLGDEHTDISGLMSSPEKMTDTKTE